MGGVDSRCKRYLSDEDINGGNDLRSFYRSILDESIVLSATTVLF
jgi:hypothetical protein